MTARELMLVAWIRAKCAREFECERDYPFFCVHANDAESDDETILRVFKETREDFPLLSDEGVLMVMIHG